MTDKVQLARVDCENSHSEDVEGSWIVSASLVAEIDCPICGESLEEVLETYDSALAEVETDPEEDLGIV